MGAVSMAQPSSSMKEKTPITLSHDLLAKIDREVGPKRSRSAVMEQALRDYFDQRGRQAANARDLARINATADRLNFGKRPKFWSTSRPLKSEPLLAEKSFGAPKCIGDQFMSGGPVA